MSKGAQKEEEELLVLSADEDVSVCSITSVNARHVTFTFHSIGAPRIMARSKRVNPVLPTLHSNLSLLVLCGTAGGFRGGISARV